MIAIAIIAFGLVYWEPIGMMLLLIISAILPFLVLDYLAYACSKLFKAPYRRRTSKNLFLPPTRPDP
jgi:hypothetical protein